MLYWVFVSGVDSALRVAKGWQLVVCSSFASWLTLKNIVSNCLYGDRKHMKVVDYNLRLYRLCCCTYSKSSDLICVCLSRLLHWGRLQCGGVSVKRLNVNGRRFKTNLQSFPACLNWGLKSAWSGNSILFIF